MKSYLITLYRHPRCLIQLAPRQSLSLSLSSAYTYSYERVYIVRLVRALIGLDAAAAAPAATACLFSPLSTFPHLLPFSRFLSLLLAYSGEACLVSALSRALRFHFLHFSRSTLTPLASLHKDLLVLEYYSCYVFFFFFFYIHLFPFLFIYLFIF